MKTLSFYIILLHGLFLGIATANAKLSIGNIVNQNLQDQQNINTSSRLEEQINVKHSRISNLFPSATIEKTHPSLLQKPAQVWVIDQKQQVQDQPFIWVVNDTKQAAHQPFLEVSKSTDKPDTKPATTPQAEKKDDLEEFEKVIKDTEKLDGLFTLYRNSETNKIYLEIKPEQLNKNYLATGTLESGIGEQGIYSGLPLQDFLFYFQRVDKKISL